MSTDLTTIVLNLDGMHCASCAINIDFELEDMEGVKEANTNYAKQMSTVTFDPTKVKREDLVSAIHELGYAVK